MTLILGRTVSGIVYPVLVDANGQLVGAGQSYYSGAWRKNPLVFGISGQVKVYFGSGTLPAGSSTIYSSTVPANTIWVITNIAIRYIGTVANVLIRASLNDAVTDYTIFSQTPPVSYVEYTKQGQWILLPGDRLSMNVDNATLNDDMSEFALGYSIDYNA